MKDINQPPNAKEFFRRVMDASRHANDDYALQEYIVGVPLRPGFLTGNEPTRERTQPTDNEQ